MRQWCGLVLVLVCLADAVGVKVEIQTDVAGVATDDTLQDVLATINKPYQGCLLTGLVDGGSRDTVNLIGEGKPGNGTTFYNSDGPILVTWDLGAPEQGKAASLETLAVWMYAGNGRNFHGQWSVSKDGKQFRVIPGTLVKKEFPVGKTVTQLMHAIRYSFSPNEVTGFRYLRLELLGFPGQITQIQEVDGVIRNVKPAKYTEIHTTIRPVEKSAISEPYPADQTITQPMTVHPIELRDTNLVLSDRGKVVLSLTPVFAPAKGWVSVERKISPKEVMGKCRRSDGLMRTCRAVIDVENRLSLHVSVELPKTASKAVALKETVLNFREGDIRFDGITFGSGCGPIFVPRIKATTTDIGQRTPYFIFPSAKEKIELQMYMPDWYSVMGRTHFFTPAGFATWSLFTAVKPGETRAGKWYDIEGTVQPGQKLNYRMNLAVFSETPPTIGQKDIETAGKFSPLIGIEAGTGNQQVSGAPRILQRDKMIFLGFKLPPPAKEKPGHQLQIEPTSDPRPLLDRFAKSGVGILTLMADYRDVSHGISYKGDYQKCPPGFPDLLRQIRALGMKGVGWFSPRGFLQKDWGAIPKDKIVEQHPDWFTAEAHWFGYYRTVDIFNPAPSEWCEAKMKQDLKNYSDLMGFAYDTFPYGILTTGPKTGVTGCQSEAQWLKRFSNSIWSFGKDKVVISNGGPPGYDEYLYYDYTVSEHPLLMFVNEVVAGKMPFGHTYVPWELFGQLYFWYPVIGHMYYNFCDYDQGFAWVGPSWLGLEPGQMAKDFDRDVASLWYIMGRGRRIYGAQIAPMVRQVEAKMPDGSIVMVVCSLSEKAANIRVRPQRLEKRAYNVTAVVDTAKEHVDVAGMRVDLTKGEGLEIHDLPPFSMIVFRLSPG